MSDSKEVSLSERNANTLMTGASANVPRFESMGQVIDFAKVMSKGGVAVRKHLRENPGACTAVTLQAMRWEMDPFAVANSSYEVNDQLAYESKLINAVINVRAPIVGRLRTRFEGQGNDRRCIAWATFQGDAEPTEVTSPPFSLIQPKNSPLWKSDPDQQLAYYTKRAWARRECPEVLLGVYDVDELPPIERGPDRARDITPPRPNRDAYANVGQKRVIEAEEVNEEQEFDPALYADGLVKQVRAAKTSAEIDAITDANADEIARLDPDVSEAMFGHIEAHRESLATPAKAAKPAASDDDALNDLVRQYAVKIDAAKSIEELNAIGADKYFLKAADHDEGLEPLMTRRRGELAK
jgi:hypothetical protein